MDNKDLPGDPKDSKKVEKSGAQTPKVPKAKKEPKKEIKKVEKYKMPRFPQSYEIPDSILKQLQEHSLGYMLIALDNQGQLKLYERFDNSITAEAVRIKFGKILAAQEEISNTLLFNSLVPDELRNDDDEE